MEKHPKPLRVHMPQVAAFVDELRAAFGDQEVDQWVRDGLRCLAGAGFYAREADREIGRRLTTGA